MTTLKRNLPSLFVLAAMIALGVVMFGRLPELVPIQYGLDGDVTNTTPRGRFVALLPALYVFIIVWVNVMIRVSPQKFSMPQSKRAMDIILFGAGVLMLCIYLGTMLKALDKPSPGSLSLYGLAAFFVITGNVFGKTERNFFIGIRLPWTINSNANWKATHRLAGKLLVVSGLLLALINAFVDSTAFKLLFVLAPIAIPLIYSPYRYFRYEKNAESAQMN